MRAFPTFRQPLHQMNNEPLQFLTENDKSSKKYHSESEPTKYFMSQRDAFDIPIDFNYFSQRCYEQLQDNDFTSFAFFKNSNNLEQKVSQEINKQVDNSINPSNNSFIIQLQKPSFEQRSQQKEPLQPLKRQMSIEYFNDEESANQFQKIAETRISYLNLQNNNKENLRIKSQAIRENEEDFSFMTPKSAAQKRKNKKFCIVDSDRNVEKRNNPAEELFKTQSEKRQILLSDRQIIVNKFSSQSRKQKRKSSNSLHITFQKQITGSFNNSQKQGNILEQESNKLRKLVKNKRKSNEQFGRLSETKEENIGPQLELRNCAICLSLPEDNIYGTITCSHQFCLDCIVQWSRVTNQCPMCRKEFFEILPFDYNDPDLFLSQGKKSDINKPIKVDSKKQRIEDTEEFYWEEASFLEEDALDEVCYICETDQDEEKLIICDHCGVRICHTYCDNDLFDDSVPLEDWFCHECRLRSELFD